MSVAGQNYMSALLLDGTTAKYLKHGRTNHLFSAEADALMHEFVDGFVRKYGQLPAPETFTAHTKMEIVKPKEPAEYYLDVLRETYIESGVRSAAKAASALLTGETKSPSKALSVLQSGLATIQAHAMAQQVLDYREAELALMAATSSSIWGGDNMGIKFGWPTLDALAGGIGTGDVVSVVGNTGSGKTWCLLWIAYVMWMQGKVPLFVSMEIKPTPIFQRLSAMHSKKPFGEIKLGQLSTTGQEHYTTLCASLKDFPHPFWVADGNLAANVSDIQSLALQLKPDIIVIDGAYLMTHPTERDRYRRVAENAEMIKMNLAEICPVVASWQFAADAKKLKKGEKPGLEHIGSSIVISQISSLVLAFLEDDSIETETRRKIDLLKGRNGESAEFFIKWAFDQTTDFSEASPLKLEDMTF